MDETQQVPNQIPVTASPITTTPTTQPAPKSKTSWTFIIVIVVLLGIASYFGYQNYQLKQQLTVQQPTPTLSTYVSSPTPAVSPITSINPTENPTTYTNTQYFYSLKYPNTWLAESFGPGANLHAIDTTSRGIILSPNNQKATVPDPMFEIQAEGSENLSRPTYADWVKQTKANFSEAYKLTKESAETVSGVTAIVLEGEHVYPKSSTYVKQYILKSNKDVYFTFTIACDSKQIASVFDSVMSSVQFTK